MQIVITATDRQWEEWPAKDQQTTWIRVADGNAFAENANADAFINLIGCMILPSYAALQKPVLINSVTATLSGMSAPANVLRINGWPDFLLRPVWEVAGKLDEAASTLFEQLNKKVSVVADEPGLITARIVSMIINEAYFAIGDKVSSKEEIDTAMKLGTNYPFGPFEWASVIGPEFILELLQELNKTDKRYQPAPALLDEITTLHT